MHCIARFSGDLGFWQFGVPRSSELGVGRHIFSMMRRSLLMVILIHLCFCTGSPTGTSFKVAFQYPNKGFPVEHLCEIEPTPSPKENMLENSLNMSEQTCPEVWEEVLFLLVSFECQVSIQGVVIFKS